MCCVFCPGTFMLVCVFVWSMEQHTRCCLVGLEAHVYARPSSVCAPSLLDTSAAGCNGLVQPKLHVLCTLLVCKRLEGILPLLCPYFHVQSWLVVIEKSGVVYAVLCCGGLQSPS